MQQSASGNKRAVKKTKRVFFFALFSVFMAYSALSSKYFALQNVQIIGTKALKLRDVLSLLHVKPEEKFYFLHLSSLVQKLEKHPKIRHARVERVFPHILDVRIEERKPLFSVTVKGFTYVLDEDRVVMEKIPALGSLLPSVQGVSLEAIPGQKADDRRFQLSVACLKSAGVLLPLRVSTLAFSNMEMVLYTDRGMKVKFGDGKNISEKMQRLKAVLQAVRKKNLNVKYIDLQSMDRPAIGIEKKPGVHKAEETEKNT